EREWLTNMRDWMISKKRFWGLALPIWVNPDDASDFEVIGSLAELKERAVEGWDEFEGHTPHRPWIDGVKIKSRKTGAVLSRVVDVGNPWLDAGIVPFSTLNYNKRYPNELLNWSDWYSPEFVVECFPGQFRNWFYSLLALSTMMRYDETTDPAEKRPFKTLLGHRLVMNEEGKPMHKSDGTAIWFEEAAEQLGVDTLRWLYLAQDPATDLRFGTRHKDEPVSLPTVDGPLSHTREGLPCCKVTSKPADEVRRQVLIPLWNSYAFFVNYARLDGFDPARGPKVTDPAVFAKLGEMDRWILSNLQQLIAQCRTGFEEFDTASVCKAIAAFIDDMSNWYIRRSRRRFWRSTKDDAPPLSGEPKATASDNDKWEAYATLYEVLLTLSKLTAPAMPFLAERMYQNLRSDESPQSVHLCAYPEPISALIDSALSARMATAERIVGLGLRLRELENLRVRQPLSKLQYVASDEAAAHIDLLTAVIAEELNVREIVRAEHLDELVSYKYKPNKKTLGPKYGKQLGAIDKHLATAETDPAVARELAPLRRGEPVTIADLAVTLSPEDVLIATERAGDWATADEAGLQIALATALTPELVHEGMARDFVRHIQQARKDANLEITDRIRVFYSGAAEVTAAVNAWKEYIARETLADAVEQTTTPSNGDAKVVAIGDAEGVVWIEKA
ncbi:MAG: class I tRNA ligase family protein, partial [Planctomycetaceae bacterium]|nr:class I tRNA ligase family protein [Planctomycetaceae bacterium]